MRIKILHNSVYSRNAAALLLGAAGLFSRFLGIIRDRMLAAHFGASRALDIYYAAFQIPDLMFTIFLIGAASAAIIPIFLEVYERDQEEAKRFVLELMGVFIVASAAVSFLIIIFAPYLIKIVAPGFSASEQAVTINLMRIMMASPVLLGMSSIASSVIQSFRRFFAYAFAAIFYNIGIILGIIFFLPHFGLTGLAIGVVLGAFLHFFVQFEVFWKLGFRLPNIRQLIKDLYSARIRLDTLRVVRLSLPRVIALSIDSLTSLVLIALASTLVAGSITVFKFANNLRYLPVGLFGVSFAIASFPSLSENAIRKDADKFYQTLYGSIRSVLFWVLPIAILFYVLRAQIVRIALGAGAFNWYDTRLTAAALGLFTVAIITESLIQIYIRSYYALGNTRKPLAINISTAAATILLSLILIKVFSGPNFFSLFVSNFLKIGNLGNISVLGIALAVSIGDVADFIFLSRGLKKEAQQALGPAKSGWNGDVLKLLAASFACGTVGFVTLRFINIFISIDTLLGVLIQGTAASMAGALSYALILYFCRNRELLELIETIKRKIFTVDVLPAQLDGETSVK